MLVTARRLIATAAAAIPLMAGLAGPAHAAPASSPSATGTAISQAAASNQTSRAQVDLASRDASTTAVRSERAAAVPPGGVVAMSWRHICWSIREAGVRHQPGGPAFVYLAGGSDVYVDDYRDRVWVHINWPVSGYVLYSVIC
jgi:hypothetical protein